MSSAGMELVEDYTIKFEVMRAEGRGHCVSGEGEDGLKT